MRIILLILASIVLFSCSNNQDDSVINHRPPHNNLIIGDTVAKEVFDIPLKLIGNNGPRIDSLVTDTLYVDLDKNGVNEFTFIYVGKFIAFSNLGTPTRPTMETIHVNVGDQLMVLDGGFTYGLDKTLNISSLNDTLTWDGKWIWSYNHILYQRVKNEMIGAYGNMKRYLAYKRPFESKWGWIEFQLKFDDYYIESMIIDEFADKKNTGFIMVP